MNKTNRIFNWALYDFANTIFSAIVLTAYFPLYLTKLTGSAVSLGFATTVSMVLAGLALPVFGALSDRTGGTKRYLVDSTLACLFFLILLSLVKTPGLLIFLFAASCFFYHAALVFYNALLPLAAPPEKQNFASGLGTGLGYLGVVFSLPLANIVEKKFGTPAVFQMAALLFLIFSFPVFLGVPERGVKNPVRVSWKLWREEWRIVLKLILHLRNYPALAFFLAGNFLVVDALNATIFWFLVYAREVFNPGQPELIRMLLFVNASAFAGGIFMGWIGQKIGAMKTMLLSSLLLVLTLAGMALMPAYIFFLILSVTAGAFAIAGIWTAGRKVLIELSPADKIGEYFGLYGLTTKISVIGNLAFSIIAERTGYRSALAMLIVPAAAGAFFIWRARKEFKN